MLRLLGREYAYARKLRRGIVAAEYEYEGEDIFVFP
jgi:hypothetical protein